MAKQRIGTLQFVALLILQGACGQQTLEGGSLGRGDAQADGSVIQGDAQGDGLALTCTYEGVVYPHGATMPGRSDCEVCRCQDGRMDCGTQLCLRPMATLCSITADIKDANPGVGYRSTDVPLPTTHVFSLYIDWQGKTVMTGANGTGAKVTISRDANTGDWSTLGDLAQDPVLYATEVTHSHRAILDYQQITIRPTIDGCTGHATGTFSAITGGDVVFEVPFEAGLVGVTDHTGPGLAFDPSASEPPHPLDVEGVRVSELLPLGTSARLVADDGTVVPLASQPVDSLAGVSGFLLDKRTLNFATTYRLEVLPSAVDLAGNQTTVFPSLTTAKGPGLFAQDGFEGPVEALLGGQVKVIDVAARVPTGKRALQFAPTNFDNPEEWSRDDRFTARLQVPPGATAIKLTVLPYKSGSSASAPFSAWLRLAEPNGAVIQSEYWWLPSTEGMKKIELLLPAGVGSEVIFDLKRGTRLCQGLILDDLRVE